MSYSVGDVVSWSTDGVAGEFTFIGHPKADKAGKILVLAMAAEVGFEADVDECSPTGLNNPQRGREVQIPPGKLIGFQRHLATY